DGSFSLERTGRETKHSVRDGDPIPESCAPAGALAATLRSRHTSSLPHTALGSTTTAFATPPSWCPGTTAQLSRLTEAPSWPPLPISFVASPILAPSRLFFSRPVWE